MLNIITRLLSDEIRKYFKENDPVIFFLVINNNQIFDWNINYRLKKSIREIGIQIDY